MDDPDIVVRVAKPSDSPFAERITLEMEASAKARGTGIARRSPEYIVQKMTEGKAVIALTRKGEWESGSFMPPKTLSHTHHGSIGNPEFQSIRDQLSKSTLTVKWERSKLALRRLAEGSATATN